MRIIRLHMQISTDGYTMGPYGESDWIYRHSGPEVNKYTNDLYAAADVMVMGRLVYYEMADYWPRAESDPASVDEVDREGAAWLNAMPKLILSRTLQSVGWHNCRLVRDAAAELNRLKQEPGRDIIVAGGATTARSLIHEGLIDELNIMVHPVILGGGKPLFTGLTGTRELTLLEARHIGSGVVLLHYQL